MRTEHLEYLLDLYETLSLSKTANNFFTSHQVINNAIKSLESEFNVQILNRTHRGIHFTKAGLLIYNYAKEVVSGKQKLLNNLSPYCNITNSVQKGTLNIYIIPRYNNTFFMNFYNLYCNKNKSLSISLKNCHLISFLENNIIDSQSVILATLLGNPNYGESFMSQNYLSYTILADHLLGFCVSTKSKYFSMLQSSNYNITDIPIVTFAYSAEEPSLFNTSPSYYLFNKSYYLIDNFDLQKKMIKSGKYVGIYTQLEFNLFFKSDPNMAFVDMPSFFGGSKLSYIALYNKNSHQQPVDDVISLLKQYYQAKQQ